MKMKGIAMYPRVNADFPDDKYEPCWKLTLVVDKETRDRVIADTGAKFSRTNGDAYEKHGEYQVNIRRYVYKKLKGKFTTTKNKAPKIYIEGELTDKQPMADNGSEVIVEFSPYSWTYKGGKGVSLDLNAVNYLKLVEYVPDEDTESDMSTVDDTVNEIEDTKWDEDDF